MKSISGKNFCRILSNKGWELKRVSGSHHIFIKDGVIARISVPVHKNRTLKIGLLRYLMKIANLTESDL